MPNLMLTPEGMPYICVSDLFPVDSVDKTIELFKRWDRNKIDVAQAQLAKAEPLIRKDERERILRMATPIQIKHTDSSQIELYRVPAHALKEGK